MSACGVLHLFLLWGDGHFIGFGFEDNGGGYTCATSCVLGGGLGSFRLGTEVLLIGSDESVRVIGDLILWLELMMMS